MGTRRWLAKACAGEDVNPGRFWISERTNIPAPGGSEQACETVTGTGHQKQNGAQQMGGNGERNPGELSRALAMSTTGPIG